MNTVDDLKFPVLILGDNPEEGLSITDNVTHLKVATSLSLQKGTLMGCNIFDSSGRIYKIKSISNLGKLNSFWKFDFFNPMYKIKLNLEFIGIVESLDDLKVKVSDSIDHNSEIWAENFELTRLKKKLKSAKNIKKIIDSLNQIE